MGNSAWALSRRVPVPLKYHVPSLCGDQAASLTAPTPSESQAIAHSPRVRHWAALLGTFTGPWDGLSCFQALVRKNARKPKGCTSPSMTPCPPPQTGRFSPWKWDNGMQQNWGTREAAWVWQERAERDRFPNLASPVLTLVALASYLPPAPRASVSSWVRWGTTAPILKTVRICNNLCRMPDIK